MWKLLINIQGLLAYKFLCWGQRMLPAGTSTEHVEFICMRECIALGAGIARIVRKEPSKAMDYLRTVVQMSDELDQ